MNKIFLLLLFLSFTFLNASQSEEKLKAVIMGKVAKFITWKDNTHNTFVITILDNPFNGLIDKLYESKKIKSKRVQIIHTDSINNLGFTNILYIPASRASELSDILKKTKNKNILLVSDIRGFAEKKGTLQIYFVSQKIKLKINLDTAKKENLKIKSSLLRIVSVIQEDK
jgi:hypothetical protein